ncbi:hypothetical protein DFH28DRAFT_958576 [Melampsora americana]|nr:hypothetical protein DFH28DRAFT_958576 [Melampsora americana]
MRSITYIFFVATYLSLCGHVISQSGFSCDSSETLKPAIGICAPDGIRPNNNEPLIDWIPNASHAKSNGNIGGFSWWSCLDYEGRLVSYCCTVAPDNTHKFAAGCRRQH